MRGELDYCCPNVISIAPSYSSVLILLCLRVRCLVLTLNITDRSPLEAQSKEIYQFESYESVKDHFTMQNYENSSFPASRIVSDRTEKNGTTIINKAYFFEAACDMSKLQNADLYHSTITFEGAVYIDTLEQLKMDNVTLVFKNGSLSPAKCVDRF